MDVGETARLSGHRFANFGDSVPYGDDGSSARRVKITLAVGGVNEAPLTSDGLGIGSEKIPGENGFVRHGPPAELE
jgi:hypothetical protein